jgi:hypothetical protein
VGVVHEPVENGVGIGSRQRRDPAGANLRRGAGRVQLHLRRSNADPEPAGLDRRAWFGRLSSSSLKTLPAEPYSNQVDRPAGIVNEQPLAGGMGLPHCRRQPTFPGAVQLALDGTSGFWKTQVADPV